MINRNNYFLVFSLTLLFATGAQAANYEVYIHGAMFTNCDDNGQNEQQAKEGSSAFTYGWNRPVAQLGGYTSTVYLGSANYTSKYLAYDGNRPSDDTHVCAGVNVVHPHLETYCGDGNQCRVICYSQGCYITDRFLAENHQRIIDGELNIEFVVAYASASGGGPIGEHLYQALRFVQGLPEGGGFGNVDNATSEVEVRHCTAQERQRPGSYHGHTATQICNTLDSYDLPSAGDEAYAATLTAQYDNDYNGLRNTLALRPRYARGQFDHNLTGGVPVYHIAGHKDSDLPLAEDMFNGQPLLYNNEHIYGLNDGAVTAHSACGYKVPELDYIEGTGAPTPVDAIPSQDLARDDCLGGGELWDNHVIHLETTHSPIAPLGSVGSYNFHHNEALGSKNLNWWGNWWILLPGVPVTVADLDSEAVQVTTTPSGGEDLPTDTVIILDFDEAMDPDSVSITLYTTNYAQIPYTSEWTSDTQLRLHADPALPSNSIVGVAGIEASDRRGNDLPQQWLSIFYTGQ